MRLVRSDLAVEQTAERREFPEERFEVVRREARAGRARSWPQVVVLAILQVWLASRIVTPWIMIDELIYSDLARSLGDERDAFTCAASRSPGRTSATSS